LFHWIINSQWSADVTKCFAECVLLMHMLLGIIVISNDCGMDISHLQGKSSFTFYLQSFFHMSFEIQISWVWSSCDGIMASFHVKWHATQTNWSVLTFMLRKNKLIYMQEGWTKNIFPPENLMEATSKVLHLEHSFVWCTNLDTS
jgi:hypothetical protein